MSAKNVLQECVIGCQALRVHEFVWGVSLDFIPMEKKNEWTHFDNKGCHVVTKGFWNMHESES